MTTAPHPGGRSSPLRREVSARRGPGTEWLSSREPAAFLRRVPSVSRHGPLTQGVSTLGHFGWRPSHGPNLPSSTRAPVGLLSGILTSPSLCPALDSARAHSDNVAPLSRKKKKEEPCSHFVAGLRTRPSFLPFASSRANSSTLVLELTLHYLFLGYCAFMHVNA